jgi:hypothetical protein
MYIHPATYLIQCLGRLHDNAPFLWCYFTNYYEEAGALFSRIKARPLEHYQPAENRLLMHVEQGFRDLTSLSSPLWIVDDVERLI